MVIIIIVNFDFILIIFNVIIVINVINFCCQKNSNLILIIINLIAIIPKLYFLSFNFQLNCLKCAFNHFIIVIFINFDFDFFLMINLAFENYVTVITITIIVN